MTMKPIYSILSFLSLIAFISCGEQWLDKKSSLSLVVPSTLRDLKALLDNTAIMSETMPVLGEAASDNYFVTYNRWQVNSRIYANAYVWSNDIYNDVDINNEWNYPYRKIYYTNIALEGLQKLQPNPYEQDAYNNVRGMALFHRADAWHRLSQIFSASYYNTSSATDSGIPLRLTTDVTTPLKLSTVGEVYQQIVADLKKASELLPIKPAFKTNPSKPAAFATLARVFLTMENYELALMYADSCLQLYDTLLDYNQLNPADAYPIPFLNDEVIIQMRLFPGSLFGNNYFVDSLLYESYEENDLRKTIFFRDKGLGGYNFIGSYDNGVFNFGGIATDEIYLIRAECYARNGDIGNALKDLNTLLEKRWKSDTFVPLVASNQEETLTLILTERRKELIFRALRWSDLRRLNKDTRFAKTLVRVLNDQTYTLPPNDTRYVFPFPPNVLRLGDYENQF
ncbi:RagB/SusD family nutrient uptake outer membrane protein [Parapedobacter sp. 10938]|uniref:RagB/SusD family nutrient uptake outer membrane protein n=1 Tax=Parapedobacter flavus TaxID=3110225 RepID=UPI002DBB3003|nr:RagB/SusD family nutrient uptake outer membrane protein [Parapedobacter sp. 10938]MEC3880213.1 RagB/SusD family nutrient uptake outer membrane protein [Parapedobacter sp. 10938]